MGIVKYYMREYSNNVLIVSGESPNKGVDWVAKGSAKFLGVDFLPVPPDGLGWDFYKRRNIKLANIIDHCYCVSVESPQWCKHCKCEGHTENGGCWTIKYAAKELNKRVSLIVV